MNLLNKMKATNSPPAIAVFATSEVTKDEVVERVASALVLLRIGSTRGISHDRWSRKSSEIHSRHRDRVTLAENEEGAKRFWEQRAADTPGQLMSPHPMNRRYWPKMDRRSGDYDTTTAGWTRLESEQAGMREIKTRAHRRMALNWKGD